MKTGAAEQCSSTATTPSSGCRSNRFAHELPAEKKKRLEDMVGDCWSKLQKSDDAKPLPIAHGLAEATPANMKIFQRGNPAKLGDEAPRRFLKILAGDDPAPFKQGSGRLDLAEAIASKDNPLTARSWSIVSGSIISADRSSARPATLANSATVPRIPSCSIISRPASWKPAGRSKKLHREIMLSAVYQLSSDAERKELRPCDGDNRWLWRMNRRRLDVEVVARCDARCLGQARSQVGRPDHEPRRGGQQSPHRLREDQPARSEPLAAVYSISPTRTSQANAAPRRPCRSSNYSSSTARS